MDAVQKLALMDKIIRELDDLKKSQTAVLKKIAQAEADNIYLNSTLLNDGLPAIHAEVDEAVQKLGRVLDDFQENRNAFVKENPQLVLE